MKRGNKMSVSTAALTIALGGLTLVGCGGSQQQAQPEGAAQAAQEGAAKSCGGDAKPAEGGAAEGGGEKSCGGDAKPAEGGEGGGEKSCGAGSCGG
jgi:hypothetical protein